MVRFFCEWLRVPILRHGISLNIIEPDRIDDEKNELTADGNQIRMGVELDRDTKRPVAYWVLDYHKGDYDYMTPLNAKKYKRVLAEEMIHIYRMGAGQTRGVPWSAAAMSSMKMLHGYREAELVAARTGAAKMGFFTSPAGDGFTADGYEDTHTPNL